MLRRRAQHTKTQGEVETAQENTLAADVKDERECALPVIATGNAMMRGPAHCLEKARPCEPNLAH